VGSVWGLLLCSLIGPNGPKFEFRSKVKFGPISLFIQVDSMPQWPRVALARYPLSALGFSAEEFRSVRASPLGCRLAGNVSRIEFVACGLVIHLQLLSTLPRGNAVTFGYGPESACPKRTYTSLFQYLSKRTPLPARASRGCRKVCRAARSTRPRTQRWIDIPANRSICENPAVP
jgi:hypothetical protein